MKTGKSTPILESLRAATRKLHADLEGLTPSERIMDKTLSPEEYRSLIDWQERVHRRLEPQLLNFSQGDYRYQPRFAPDDHAPAAAPISKASAVGILYVLEGSSLGGGIIYRKLIDNPGLQDYSPFPFYRFQAETGRSQWKSFLAFLSEHSFTEAEIAEASESAVATFKAFEEAWLAGK